MGWQKCKNIYLLYLLTWQILEFKKQVRYKMQLKKFLYFEGCLLIYFYAYFKFKIRYLCVYKINIFYTKTIQQVKRFHNIFISNGISLYFVIFRRPAQHSKIMLDFGNLKEQVNTILVRVNHHHILLTIKMSEEAINLRIIQHIKIPKVISLRILG